MFPPFVTVSGTVYRLWKENLTEAQKTALITGTGTVASPGVLVGTSATPAIYAKQPLTLGTVAYWVWAVYVADGTTATQVPGGGVTAQA